MTLEVKSVDAPQRVITAYAAVAGNLDRTNDIIDPGAFKTCLAEKPPTAVSVFIGHKTDDLAVGVCRAWQFDGKGLLTETKVFDGPAGDNLLANVRGMMAVGRAVGASIGYRTRKSAPERYDGKLVRRLLDIDVMEYSFADSNAVANQQALVVGVKSRGKALRAGDDSAGGATVPVDDRKADAEYHIEQRDDGWHVIDDADGDDLGTYDSEAEAQTAIAALVREENEPDDEPGDSGKIAADAVKAEWSTAFVNDLPDSSFLYVSPGGQKDEGGKTVPRSNRHFPYKDAEGKIDLPHLRNAIARIPQSDVPNKDALQARAQRLLADAQGGSKLTGDEPEWQDGAALALYGVSCDLQELAEAVAAQYQAMKIARLDTKDNRVVPPPERAILDGVIERLVVIRDRAAQVAAGEETAAKHELNRRRLQFLEMVS